MTELALVCMLVLGVFVAALGPMTSYDPDTQAGLFLAGAASAVLALVEILGRIEPP